MEYIKEIETPAGKNKVVIKTMLTGAERETVTAAPQEFIKTSDGKSVEVTDMKKMSLAEKHMLLKLSVLSIDGNEVNCFDQLQKMYEVDYAFVYDSIIETQKKMMESTSPASS